MNSIAEETCGKIKPRENRFGHYDNGDGVTTWVMGIDIRIGGGFIYSNWVVMLWNETKTSVYMCIGEGMPTERLDATPFGRHHGGNMPKVRVS